MKPVQVILKSTYTLSKLIICVWVFMLVLRLTVSFGFSDNTAGTSAARLLFWMGLCAIPGTLTGTIKLSDSNWQVVRKTVLTLIIPFVLFFGAICSSMCVWTGHTLYTNKENSSAKIVERNLGCGAWDSGPPIVQIVKEREFLGLFVKRTSVNLATLDKAEWTPVQ